MFRSALDQTVMHPLIQQHRAAISSICRRYGIRRLEVFGSSARGVDFDPSASDADFLVEFASDADIGIAEFFAAKSELERALGRAVDLVQRKAIRNPYLLADIDRHKELIYAA